MRALILAALVAAAPAMAVPVARNGSDVVRLLEAPCIESIARLIKPEVRERYRLARATVEGQEWSACWALRPDGLVVLIYEDGDGGLIPAAQFKDEPGV
jgi:hypothetical protein